MVKIGQIKKQRKQWETILGKSMGHGIDRKTKRNIKYR